MSRNVDYFTKKETELSEAVLKISYFTGKVKNNKTAEKLGIKIKVLGGGEGNAHIAMSGTEEALKKYASRFLGADKNDSLSQIQNDVGGPYFGENFEFDFDNKDELGEAILKVGMFTGKVKDNKTAEKLGIKIRVHSSANPGNNIIMSGPEESLIKYAVRFLGAEKGGSLSQVQNDVIGMYDFARDAKESVDWTSKINEKIEEYIQEGSCSSKKKLHANYKEDSEYQEFFKKALEKFGVESPDELDDEKKKEFFDYVDSNWNADKESD